MDGQGTIDPTFKACKSDTDCVIRQHAVDCCGAIEFVGIATAGATSLASCETAWGAHFPACGCDSGMTKTEDGKESLPGQDAGALQVHCTNFTNNGGVCMTSTP
jgi:hypothetical protein